MVTSNARVSSMRDVAMKCVAAMLGLLALSGCASTYTLLYDTRARFDCIPNDNCSLVQFAIDTLPNGILLSAANHSKSTVEFDWDNSYLVLPSGERCKARTMGFWSPSSPSVFGDKPRNSIESMSHANALISAASYADALDSATVATICRDWRRRGQLGGWPESLYRVGSYWPTELVTSRRGRDGQMSMEQLATYLAANDNLQVVVAYQEQGIPRECRVSVKIFEVSAVTTHRHVDSGRTLELRKGKREWVYNAQRAEWTKRQ